MSHTKTDEPFTPRFATPERFEWAPKFPTDRPPTRREYWERYHAVFYDFKGHRKMPGCTDKCLHTPEGELEVYCRDGWAYHYVEAVVFRGWDKQPDWDGEAPVIPAAVLKTEMLTPGNFGQWLRTVYALLETANQLTERSAA